MNKFTGLAIKKTQEEMGNLKLKNYELNMADEEIRASNEELIATTDALRGSNNELLIANEKAKESDRLKTEFLNNISHEVRTPMNGIVGFSQLLRSEKLKDENKEFYITTIIDSSNQLMKIIEDIINMSKLITKQVNVSAGLVNVGGLLSQLHLEFETRAEVKNIEFRIVNRVGNDIQICTDRNMIYIILENFIDNAIKFTDIGFVEVGCGIVEVDNVKSIQFYVKDTGIGIEEVKRESIFEKFNQVESKLSRTYGGLGLGLSIAKAHAVLLGGKINLKSEKDKGSMFYFTIPV